MARAARRSIPLPRDRRTLRRWAIEGGTGEDFEASAPDEAGLLCGDVGYGEDRGSRPGRRSRYAVWRREQASYVVPDHDSSPQQQSNTFRERYCDFPVRVEMVVALPAGPADAAEGPRRSSGRKRRGVIGTHRVLARCPCRRILGLRGSSTRKAALRRGAQKESSCASCGSRSTCSRSARRRRSPTGRCMSLVQALRDISASRDAASRAGVADPNPTSAKVRRR